MGNWRTVRIVGSCDETDIDALLKATAWSNDSTLGELHCLSRTSGLFGLGNWVSTNIWAQGNLAERDYDVKNVADQLQKLASVAPSLELTIHCGGDYESRQVVNTIELHDGQVFVNPPALMFL